MAKIATIYRPTAATAAAATYSYGESSSAVLFAQPATDEDTANSMTVSFAGVLTGPIDRVIVQIRNASNVTRNAQGAVTISGTSVTIADTGLVTTDLVTVLAFSTPLI